MIMDLTWASASRMVISTRLAAGFAGLTLLAEEAGGLLAEPDYFCPQPGAFVMKPAAFGVGGFQPARQ
jgi:hypothetical protein